MEGGARCPGAEAAAAAPKFEVKSYALDGNTILKPPEVEALLSPYTGKAVDLGQIREGLSTLQLEYRKQGYVTVSVSLPPQQLTNGVVHVNVIEGRLGSIDVTGNRHFSEANIRRALPSLRTNILLNSRWFQPELDQANNHPDRQVYPVLAPGADPGTTALTLKVKDRLPLHGRVEVNNRATPGTPSLRLETAAQYNNLWQAEHQFGLQYGISPQETKSDSQMPRFWDQPRVASYSTFYRIPLGRPSGQREDYERSPSSFGYDPVTRQFRAPNPTGRPELLVFASRSFSDTRVRLGPVTAITNGVWSELSSQTAEKTLNWNEGIGSRLLLPLGPLGGIRSSLSLGADYKRYASANLSTNLTYYDTWADSVDNPGTRGDFLSRQTIPLESNSDAALFYVPLSLAWSGSRPDRTGTTLFSLGDNLYLRALGSARRRFQAVSGQPQAGGTFTTVNASLGRDQRLSGDWMLSLRAAGQWSSAPLISNEQFALGGSSGVRGYEEGEEYGDTGWRFLSEVRTPAATLGHLPHGYGTIPIHVRGSLFSDFGARYLLNAAAGRAGTVNMAGTGLGALVTGGEHFEARLTLAWALRDSPGTPAGSARAYFSVGVQF